MEYEDDDYAESFEGQDEEEGNTEERISELERRIEEIESEVENRQSGNEAGFAMGISWGASLVMILSWSRNGSILWCLLHGLLSWVQGPQAPKRLLSEIEVEG